MAPRAKSAALWLYTLLRPYRIGRAHPRLFIGFLTGIATGFLLPSSLLANTRLLLAWNIGIWVYFFLSLRMIHKATPATMRQRAKETDEGKFLILVLTAVAAFAAIASIVLELSTIKSMAASHAGWYFALTGVTILNAWFFIHLSFALHYAHEYYDAFEAEPDQKPEDRGGLVFPGTIDPDYYDFLYFSYVIGVASQTADIGLSSRLMRRTALVHCILSFFFNSAVLALTVNIVAGLL
nr:DUF1345 domain-containing protein [Beijerinckia indica]